jgi:hypothetical protein
MLPVCTLNGVGPALAGTMFVKELNVLAATRRISFEQAYFEAKELHPDLYRKTFEGEAREAMLENSKNTFVLTLPCPFPLHRKTFEGDDREATLENGKNTFVLTFTCPFPLQMTTKPKPKSKS